eukprot:m.205850 g.205850  ORF g.205850 m.205850 type:complete len:170 (+) comp15791_c0_seq13:210-719(+)
MEFPAPLSPLFKEGGYFAGYNEDLIEVGIVMLLLAIMDLLVIQKFLQPGSRWFALHVIGNSIATFSSAPDVWRGLTDPANSWSGPSYTMWANSAITATHIYHCVAFRLSSSDIFHHAVFVITLCGLGIGFKQVAYPASVHEGWRCCKQLWLLLSERAPRRTRLCVIGSC